MALAWRNVVAVVTLLHGAVGCGTVEDGNVVGEPLVFLDEYVTEAAPLGIWCIGRAAASLRAVPVVPDVSGPARGQLLKLGEEVWLSFRVAGEEQADAWAAPMHGCTPGRAHPVASSSRWSNAAPIYLSVDESGALSVGAPGEAAVIIAESGVMDASWSPRGTRAWYLRESPLDASLTDLFVLEIDAAEPTAAMPLFVAEGVREAAWAPDESWLAFSSGTSAALGVWSAELGTLMSVEYGEDGYVDVHPSPDSLRVGVRLPAATTAEGVELPGEYHIVSVQDGSDQVLLSGDEADGGVRWLWPEPWLQHSHDDVSILYDASGTEVTAATELAGSISQLAPVGGIAIQHLGGESAQLVSGLPTRIDPLREATWPYLGAFSPDGRYWAEVVPNVDAIGRRLDHGNQVYVVDVDRDGASELAADFGLQYFGIDGARWLDRTTFAVTYGERSQTTIAIIGLTDGEWRVEHLSLPEGETSGGRLWAPGSDPCEVLSRSVRQPGCAAPWR